MRPGFRHVRVCVECDGRLGEDGGCKCSAPSPFQRGAIVTVCSDEAGEVPIRIATIGRIGNGAFRLASSVSWYAFDGTPQSGSDGTWCRPVREGDEAIIAARVRAATRAERLADEERWLERDERDIVGARAVESMHRYEQGRCAHYATKIDPVVEGEAARVAAERSARERIYSCLFEQAEQRDLEIKAKERVRKAEESIAWRRKQIAKIKAE